MKFRVARHTNKLEAIALFYTKVLGLELLGSFKDHSGYDGIFVGKAGLDWHMEFTTSAEQVNHQFDRDDILVFYPQDMTEYRFIIINLKKHNIQIIRPKNPYWEEDGVMISDPDGYAIVISKLNDKKE